MISESSKVGTSSKVKSNPKTKSKVPRSLANSRFNYFVQCKHDLKNASTCPMCKLVNIVTRQHFIDEKAKVDQDHEQSLLNRAQLRLTLMLRWARCQSTLYNKFAPTPTFDIVMSKSLALLLVDEEAVCSRQSPIDFDEVIKVLNRRNRIQEVGHFAAIYLQTRIRKYLAQRYVRRIMLERFEYVPATRRKEAFYVDNYWMRKWNRTPKYLQNENPATPRTLSRRIAADERIRTTRYESYTKAVAKQYRSIEDVWAQEETTVQFLKQLGILRDLIRIAMLTLTKSRLRKIAAVTAMERAAEREKQAAEDARRGTPTGRRGGGSTPTASAAANRSALTIQASEDALRNEVVPELNMAAADIPLQPVWITLSAPAAPARQLGLALVLATVPSPATGAIAIRTDTEDGPPRVSAAAGSTTTGGLKQHGPSKAPVFGLPPVTPKITKIGTASSLGGSVASGLSTATPRSPSQPQSKGGARPPGSPGMITGIAQLHRSLQFLETSIWQSLKCNSPEEVLSKLVLEDLRPTLESVLNISQEPQQIWQGDIAYISHDTAMSSRPPEGFGESEVDVDIPSLSNALVSMNIEDEGSLVQESEEDKEKREKFQHEVLPLTLQLRPYHAERGCNGFFRLFFYMDELVAVTACSPWAFYPEVLKNRDAINTSLRTYAALNATRAFVQHYLTKANIHTIGGDNSNRTDPLTTLSLMGAAVSSSAKAVGSRGSSRRPSVSLQSSSTPVAPSPGRRRSVMGGNASAPVAMAQSLPIQQTELSCLYTPPESLVYADTAPDRAALMRMRDIAQFSDEKTVYMAHKYSFLNKNLAFADRLRRAELNLENRRKRRGATTTTTTAAPTKAFMDASPYHQRLAKLQQWRIKDPHLPTVLLQQQQTEEENSPQSEEVNRRYIQDIYHLRNDLIGPKLITLLQGAEAVYDAEKDSIDIFAEHYTSTTESNQSVSESKTLESIDTRSEDDNFCDEEEVEEEKLSEYEAKLHRYSRKVRMEIMDRLRQPPNVHRAQELFPLVVMDVYVQLPGKVGLSNLGGTSSNLTGMMGGTGGLQRNSTASSIGSVGSINSSTTAPTSSSSTGLLAVELQQVVGAFSCETDRCPPNLDCGLLEWDHFYHLHQQRVIAATAPPPSTAETTTGNISRLGSHSKKLSLASVSTGSSTASNLRSATSSTSWSPTNSETGVSTFISPLASASQYQFHLLGSAPSKQYLERTLPKKVKEWLGLPV